MGDLISKWQCKERNPGREGECRWQRVCVSLWGLPFHVIYPPLPRFGRPPVVKSSQGGGGAALVEPSLLLPGQVSSIGDWRRKGRDVGRDADL